MGISNFQNTHTIFYHALKSRVKIKSCFALFGVNVLVHATIIVKVGPSSLSLFSHFQALVHR